MKIVTPDQMAQLESLAFRDGASESDFMEEAGSGVALIAQELAERLNIDRHVILLCGKGNNAGDAYVAGLNLLHLDYEVTAYQLFPINECSNLCRQSHFAFMHGGGRVRDLFSHNDELSFPSSAIIIDGLFGTGFRGAIDEPVKSLIRAANQSKLPIISVDIPSGLNGKTGEVSGEAIVATITAYLGLPKMGFFLRNGWNYVGKLSFVDFGLSHEYQTQLDSDFEMISQDMMRPLMPPLKRNRHKYQAGHVVGLAGSTTLSGAALLSSLSTLCSGAGIVHLLYPKEMEHELTATPYELIKIPYKETDIDLILDLINGASATFIGPGLGTSTQTRQLIRSILPKINKPTVLDADALNIIAEEPVKLPSQVVLTPHMGEMKRLLGITKAELTPKFLEQCRAYAKEKNATLVLKGGPTFIFQKGMPTLINPKGDPGMATAGSGDVLTGLIASLLAQGLAPYYAAALGVFLHGVAGEYAANDLTSYCMTASDIISFYPDAFRPQNWQD